MRRVSAISRPTARHTAIVEERKRYAIEVSAVEAALAMNVLSGFIRILHHIDESVDNPTAQLVTRLIGLISHLRG